MQVIRALLDNYIEICVLAGGRCWRQAGVKTGNARKCVVTIFTY
jgi:hypothetical protein